MNSLVPRLDRAIESLRNQPSVDPSSANRTGIAVARRPCCGDRVESGPCGHYAVPPRARSEGQGKGTVDRAGQSPYWTLMPGENRVAAEAPAPGLARHLFAPVQDPERLFDAR